MENISQCKNLKILSELESSLDRLNESSWYIRQMEDNYHKADIFRWSLNSFLRSLKEITAMLSSEIQDNKELKNILAKKRSDLANDPLIKFLSKQRDFVVHRSMLKPKSNGFIGWFRGTKEKFTINIPIDPLSDSSDAIEQCMYACIKSTQEDNVILPIFQAEEDGSGEYTGIRREWKLSQFPDDELITLCAQAWNKVAEVVFDIASAKGANIIKPTFQLQSLDKTQIELYSPEWISKCLTDIKRQSYKDG